MKRLAMLLDELESRSSLTQPECVRERLDALDAIDRCLALSDAADDPLLSRAEAVVGQLEAINTALYRSIRDDIRGGRGAASLLQLLASAEPPEGDGYDALDELVGGVLDFEAPRLQAATLSAGMVAYQPTPARHVFAMLARTRLGKDDVLVDLGSGLGHVPLLAAICTGARAVGVELESAYVACARQVVADLALAGVEFREQDARAVDFGTGSVFYLYTPFRGALMREVLDRLRAEAARRELRICTFGPCTPIVAREPWLSTSDEPRMDRIVVFHGTRQTGG
jgi:hypothetical protein